MQPGTPWKPERPCCSGRVTNSSPFALTPSIYGGTLSPRGRLREGGGGALGSQHLPCLSTPKHPLCSSFCSSLSPQRPDTPTHLLRGLEVDALSQSGLAVLRRKSPVLTLAGRETCCCLFFWFFCSFPVLFYLHVL